MLICLKYFVHEESVRLLVRRRDDQLQALPEEKEPEVKLVVGKLGTRRICEGGV
jgi:hypothetical protein